MAIRGMFYQIAWRVDDKDGTPLWNVVENLDPGLTLPPLPDVGSKIEISLMGQTFFAEVLQARLGYAIDGTINITTTSHIWARKI